MTALLAACAQTPGGAGAAGGSETTSEANVAAEDTAGPLIEYEEGTKEAGWYINAEGSIFYIGADGKKLTGWQYLNGQWFCFGEDGAALKGWVTTSSGSWRYMNDVTGAMVTNNPVDGWYWAGADGSLTPVAGKMEEGGSARWTDVSGTNRTKFVSYLTAHAFDYLGTIYSSWPCSEPGVGLHCAGFVDRAFYDAGYGAGFWNNLAGTGYESYTFNNGYMYRADEDPYSNENCWHVGGWALWAQLYNLHWVAYATHEDAMAGAQRGEFNKGDIMIYSTTSLAAYDLSGLEHVCLYWGDARDWSLIWESSPEHDNAIVSRSEYTSYIYVLTSA